MSTNRNPLYLNTTGNTQLFSGEDTLAWDFTSGTGNPMELSVSGTTFFIFERDGSFTLEKDVTWRTDSGGTVGDAYDLRPASVNAATTLTVGAVSGAQPGALLVLNRLTLGHADVDKYIDAEQGLASTPALRYNAVNTRWEFSDNGIAYTAFSAGFGTTTWDALYAADKTLIIDAARLVFNQTSTTDVAFAFTRNLAAASTDAPITLVEQQNAADDQPALAVAQVATAASAFDIYEGTLAAGTIRFGFGATGKFTITTNAALADSALHLIQNDTGQPFVTIEGTEGAGAGVSISTDSGATVDMIRIVVNGGGGATTRWMPAYSGTVIPGVPTWDSIYLADKHLDIDAAVLQFEQTATTGRGFEVFRNLTAASTDKPIMVVEQQHASDDQPPLAIGQLAPTIDVLRLYNGSVASGTLAFQFSPRGRLNIVTNAVLGSEALRIEQNDNNVAFAEFKGTAAAGAGNNISTANGVVGDMLRVTVDDGGGANTRWVPAYNSVTLATSTWDAIYAGDKTLDIDSTVLTFDQSSTTGFGFVVSRNLAAANTDSPIMKVDQNSTTDDQPALQVTGGIADISIVAGVPALDVLSTSAGMTTGIGNIMAGVTSTVVTHATDVIGSLGRAFHAEFNDAAGGGMTGFGVSVGSGFSSGIFSESPVVIITAANETALDISPDDPTATTSFVTVFGTSGGLGTNDWTGIELDFTGHAGDLAGCEIFGMNFAFSTAGTSDSRAINIEAGWDHGLYNLSPTYLAAPVNSKVLEIAPNDPTNTYVAASIALTSGGIDGTAKTIRALKISTAGNVGDTNVLPIAGITLDHTAGGAPGVDESSIVMLVEPGYESGILMDCAPGAAGAGIIIANNGTGLSLYIADGDIANLGGATKNRFLVSKDGETNVNIDNAASGFAIIQDDTGGGGSRILTLHDGDNSIDRVKVTQNGQFLVESDVAGPGLSVTQADGTTTVIFEAASGTQAVKNARFQVAKHGAVTCTPLAPTANLDVLNITATSGVLDARTLKGLVVDFTTNAGDINTALYYGAELAMTDSGGVSTTMAIIGTGDWDKAFVFDTDPAVAEHSAVICNAGGNASHLLYLGEGTVDQIGGTNVRRFFVSKDGYTDIKADMSVGTALSVTQDGAAGLMILNDGAADRLTIVKTGAIDIDIADNANGLRLGNNGTTTNLVQLFDGTIGAGTQRFLITDGGKVTVTTDNALADAALELNQTDADQEFVYFNGTPSDPAGGSVPADNITEITGTGAVVGPTTTGAGSETGWAFHGMIKIQVDVVGGGSTDAWIANYTVVTS
ncbi:hypothetical protein LCGC14_0645870 [marine sediment metagenome]|uniref:Uncharacterized protein n=1 Tax=marine sediment metagenome TaxID=412755 RepID=A0A0F9R2Z7_9ZZZZ